MINELSMKRVFIFALLSICVLNLPAQFMRAYSTSIRSMQMVLNDDWREPPVMRLHSDDVLQFSFDEMSHTYHRYIYRITHCRADWSPTELFDIDFLDGFNEMPIEEWENSVNTTLLYTNYTFTIPNEDVYLKLSGNYIVEIIDDEEGGEPVAEFRFSVVEQRVALSASASGNTDVDMNKSHQQLTFTVHHPKYSISNPADEVMAVVYQNRRSDNAAAGLKPTYITGSTLQYVHDRKLIFDGGNEYRRFELTDPRAVGMGVERTAYFEPHFHADLYVDKPYSFHRNSRDENGRCFVNTLEGYGTTIEADYVFAHFTLDAPYRSGGDYYLLGDFCYNRFDDSNRLEYDYKNNCYRATKLLKLGLYNYAYVWLPSGSRKAQMQPIEGSFFDTENEYLILIYHREFGSRYDKLIGYGRLDHNLEKN